jgi:phenylalanyl-tRNA synthetase beta chain
MKITLNWLKKYVEFNYSPEQLAERLTMLGMEVESVQKVSGEFEGVVVAQVVSRDKHPNADKLSLCRVNDGTGQRQIVCGADNFKAGDKVPLILPGASLPAKPGEQPFVIKVGKIRGVESHGMMCSPQELGLGDLTEGLLILREDAVVGQPFGEYLGRATSDILYDLEITPNRPDWNSLIGIAREISAITGNPLKLPDVEAGGAADDVGALVAVRIEDADLCPRYTARIVRGVKIGPSPDWLKTTMEKVGIRSINNVVDVTNYVMLEIGQPLHAFDYHLLKGTVGASQPTIVIRRATEGEKFVTLDGQERTLNQQMLLIADETKPIALAGVMGGQNSEIRPSTVDVLIESAYFKPQNIRATSKTLGFRTESSYRFERGADPGISDWASRRAARLIIETAGGQLVPGVQDAYPKPVEPREITLRPSKANELLGLQMRPEEMEIYMHQLGIKAASRKPKPLDEENTTSESLKFRIPTFRVDIKREVDLIEEIARLYGVDKIPGTSPRGAIGSNEFDGVHDQLAEARQILVGLGLFEAQGQTLIGDDVLKLTGDSGIVPLSNPLSSDMNVLRSSLLPGLLDSLRHNLNHKTNDVALFEVGRVFAQPDGAMDRGGTTSPPGKIKEERRVAIALTGQRSSIFWSGNERDAKFDIYDLKGVLEEFFEQFGMRGLTYMARPESSSLFIEFGSIHLGKFKLGDFGQLMPALAKRYDLRDAVLLAELNLDTLISRRNPGRSFKPLPIFPEIRRDVAMVVPEGTTHESVLHTVKQAKPANLETVQLFDVFRGKNIPEGQKSMAYAFTYRNTERTLTDAEANAAHEKVVEQLKQRLQAVIRE